MFLGVILLCSYSLVIGFRVWLSFRVPIGFTVRVWLKVLVLGLGLVLGFDFTVSIISLSTGCANRLLFTPKYIFLQESIFSRQKKTTQSHPSSILPAISEKFLPCLISGSSDPFQNVNPALTLERPQGRRLGEIREITIFAQRKYQKHKSLTLFSVIPARVPPCHLISSIHSAQLCHT